MNQESADRAPTSSIDLVLDEALDSAVREQWAILQASGLSSLGAHPSPSNRPHLTVAAGPRPFQDLAGLGTLLPAPVPVELGPPLLFGAGERRVLARAVVPSPEILTIHRRIHDRLDPQQVAAHTVPGAWIPHVTLARRIRLDQLAQALGLIGGPARGTVTGLRHWDAVHGVVTDLDG